MKLKLKKHWTAGWTTQRKFNTTLLRDTDKFNEFKITFNNRFWKLVCSLPQKAIADGIREDLCVPLRCPVDSLEPAYSGVPRSILPICSAVVEFR
ncbi:unnamed protein product [Schistosoma margrebowiei]|uniref:Uncharacterized protein n=1 Tax=Schistosoma margrebowiei TaxID=48269 RepID=A0A183MQL0_9TREM|nr:unnamed protein product [Schistosoma margrebowiei]